jgi:hypothetical protein
MQSGASSAGRPADTWKRALGTQLRGREEECGENNAASIATLGGRARGGGTIGITRPLQGPRGCVREAEQRRGMDRAWQRLGRGCIRHYLLASAVSSLSACVKTTSASGGLVGGIGRAPRQ